MEKRGVRPQHQVRAYADEWKIVKRFADLVKYGKKDACVLALKELVKPDPLDEYKPDPHKCPVCGKYDFPCRDSMAVCPVCGWKDDALAEDDPDSIGEGAESTLNQSLKKWAARKVKCPFCGGTHTLPKKGRGTRFYCEDCRKGFGKEPLVKTLDGEKTWPLLVKSFTFYSGDTKIKAKKKEDFILKVKNKGRSFKREMTLAEWDRVVYILYYKLFLAEWQEKKEETAKDKDNWKLKISFTDDTEKEYSGNAPLLGELKNLFLKGGLLRERKDNGK